MGALSFARLWSIDEQKLLPNYGKRLLEIHALLDRLDCPDIAILFTYVVVCPTCPRCEDFYKIILRRETTHYSHAVCRVG